MGIPKLTWFVERNSSWFYQIDIKEEIQNARSRKLNPTIVVDMMSCLRTMHGELPWIPGGQVKEFVARVKEFADSFTSLGAHLVFYIDGSLDETKVTHWMKKKKDGVEKVENVFHQMRQGRNIHGIERACGQFSVLPQNLGYAAIQALRKCGCQVIRSCEECDGEIARYATNQNCLAVLAQDSDFIIFNGTWQYWSLGKLDLHHMRVCRYDKKRIALDLRIDVEHLPILASLLGNDVIQRNELEDFHNQLVPRRGNDIAPLVNAVAEFIRSNRSQGDITKQVANQVFGRDVRKIRLFKDSLRSYSVTSLVKDEDSGDSQWDAICKMIKSRHIEGNTLELYGSAVKGLYTYPHSMEEYSTPQRLVLPPNQLIAKPLRQKIYGIMLYEKSPQKGNHHVRELVVTSRQSLNEGLVKVPAIMPRAHHPGLKALWEGDKTMDRHRWALLCEPIGIDPQTLRGSSIPKHLYIFVLALKYLINEKIDFETRELAAIVSSAVLVESYHEDDISSIQTTNVEPRGVHLATIVFQMCRFVFVLNAACGYPIPIEEANPVHYQDGKLFQRAYLQATVQRYEVKRLCENKMEKVEECKAILKFLQPTAAFYI